MSSSNRWASSWVTRATSSRRRPSRCTDIGGPICAKWPPPGPEVHAGRDSGAPVRSASVAGPPGIVVRSPKNSTSTPSPARSRSLSRHTTRLALQRAQRPPARPRGRAARPPCRSPRARRRTTRTARAARPARRRPSGPTPRPASHAGREVEAAEVRQRQDDARARVDRVGDVLPPDRVEAGLDRLAARRGAAGTARASTGRRTRTCRRPRGRSAPACEPPSVARCRLRATSRRRP